MEAFSFIYCFGFVEKKDNPPLILNQAAIINALNNRYKNYHTHKHKIKIEIRISPKFLSLKVILF